MYQVVAILTCLGLGPSVYVRIYALPVALEYLSYPIAGCWSWLLLECFGCCLFSGLLDRLYRDKN